MDLVDKDSAILKTRCDELDFKAGLDLGRLEFDLKMTMIRLNGLGLSAPQVGINARVFSMGEGDNIITCFNPEILEKSGEFEIDREGCLSFPGLVLLIRRPTWVVVKYHDALGNPWSRKFEGLWARCSVHEIDHLNGVRFVDLVSKLKLQLAEKKRLKKSERRNQNA